MYIPQIRVQPLKPFFNTRLICNYLSPEKQNNKTQPFAEKTYLMYPELLGVLDGLDDVSRKAIIKKTVEKRLSDARDEINQRVLYFDNKFKTFIPEFIDAQCRLYNYEWKDSSPYIDCYVGYIPFYPRSVEDKWFYVSYNDEERVFSGAVHEINHMIFYEKWKEMHGLTEMKGPMFPDALWFLQEMIVDTTLNDPMVKPHTLYENLAYPMFYDLMVDGKSIITYLREMYSKKNSIEDFILQSYSFTEKNIQLLTK